MFPFNDRICDGYVYRGCVYSLDKDYDYPDEEYSDEEVEEEDEEDLYDYYDYTEDEDEVNIYTY